MEGALIVFPPALTTIHHNSDASKDTFATPDKGHWDLISVRNHSNAMQSTNANVVLKARMSILLPVR